MQASRYHVAGSIAGRVAMRMRSSKLASLYADGMRLAEKEPEKALRQWMAAFGARVPSSAVTLENHRRGLACIAKRVREAAAPEDVAKFESLLPMAQQMIVDAKNAADGPVGIGYTLADRKKSHSDIGPAMNSGVRDSRCPPDVSRLEMVSKAWTAADWCRWLNNGFEAIRAEEVSAHLAFPPLRLYPIGRLLEQLGTAFSQAAEFKLAAQDRVTQALFNYLQTGLPEDVASAGNDDLFWQFFRQLGPADPTMSVAQSYIARVVSAGGSPLGDPVVDGICEAAWDLSGAPSARAWFLEWLTEYVRRPRITALLIIALLDEAVTEPHLHREAIPQAAAQALQMMPPSPSAVSSRVDELIAAGRLHPNFAEITGTTVRNADGLRLELLCLAYEVSQVGVALQPPDPIRLVDSGILELVAA